MEIGRFNPTVSILLEFHKRVQKKNFTCNVRRINRPPMDMARFLFINYSQLGHYQYVFNYVSKNYQIMNT